jgi:hypothetical protein
MFVLLSGFTAHKAHGQIQQGGDVLNEAPLTKIPQDMTYEEYRDMNRRLNIGLVLAAIPVPGLIHFYAGEKKFGWYILGTATLGLGTIIGGAAIDGEGNFPESDYDLFIINRGTKKEKRFEKIPTKLSSTDTTYKLNEIYREGSNASIALVIAGAVIIVGDIVFDLVHGIYTIEKKRDKVRFKYGKLMGLDIRPNINLKNRSTGVNIQISLPFHS